MSIASNVLHRYVAPFLLGSCMATVTLVSNAPSIVALLCVAGALGFLMTPAGGRFIERRIGAAV